MTNKNKYIKIISSTLIVGAFLFLAFGSDESKDKGSSNSTTTSSSSSTEDTPPAGYEKGGSCSQCSGSGKCLNNQGQEWVCPSCNGKGYHWVKK